MKKIGMGLFIFLLAAPVLLPAQTGIKKDTSSPMSKETSACLGCHKIFTPGIVEDWLRSLHSKTAPSSALRKPEIQRRISVQKVPGPSSRVVVGCYECHGQNSDK